MSGKDQAGCQATIAPVSAPSSAWHSLRWREPKRRTRKYTTRSLSTGRAVELIGDAGAASEGVVGCADFEDRPLSRIGELGEVIPGVVGGGLLARLDPWTLSARVRHFSEAPLIEDGSVTSGETTLVNRAGSYAWRNGTLSLQMLNAFDAKDADITYFSNPS